jgi:hypothetical protein
MSNRHYHHGIDLTPEVIELEDGRKGYFYSPQQLEEMEWRRLMDRVHDDMRYVTSWTDLDREPSRYKKLIPLTKDEKDAA